MIGKPYYVTVFNGMLGSAHALRPDYDTVEQAEARAQNETKGCQSFYVAYVRGVGPKDVSQWCQGQRVA